MMFADPDEVDAQFVGQRRLIDEIPDHDGVREQRTVDVGGDVAKGVQSHVKISGHVSASSFPNLERPPWGSDS